MVAKKSNYSLFIIFFFNSLKNRIIHYFLSPHYSLFIIIFLAHYSLFIIKEGHYSLIIIPRPDPRVVFNSSNFKWTFLKLRHTAKHQIVLYKFLNGPYYHLVASVIALCSSKFDISDFVRICKFCNRAVSP